jgi:hypothetical protein
VLFDPSTATRSQLTVEIARKRELPRMLVPKTARAQRPDHERASRMDEVDPPAAAGWR